MLRCSRMQGEPPQVRTRGWRTRATFTANARDTSTRRAPVCAYAARREIPRWHCGTVPPNAQERIHRSRQKSGAPRPHLPDTASSRRTRSCPPPPPFAPAYRRGRRARAAPTTSCFTSGSFDGRARTIRHPRPERGRVSARTYTSLGGLARAIDKPGRDNQRRQQDQGGERKHRDRRRMVDGHLAGELERQHHRSQQGRRDPPPKPSGVRLGEVDRTYSP